MRTAVAAGRLTLSRPVFWMRSLSLAACLILGACSSSTGSGGGSGTTGTSSTDATDGTDATSGFVGTDASDGTDGTDATDGSDGTDAVDGTDGADGTDASDGTDATTGATGTGVCADAPACESNADCAECAAGDDPCTGPWTCEAGACTKGAPVGDGCGQNHPCVPAATPGSNDAELIACVCNADAYCCQVEWDDQCVAVAEVDCSLDCSCDLLDAEALACTTDEQCEFCDTDFNKCNGSWSCQGGSCAPKAEVVCDTSGDVGCVTNTCDGFTGECTPTPDDSQCDDEQICTADSCVEADGSCKSEPIGEGCGMNHPCKAVGTPGSSDAEVTACVCEEDSYCCTGQWDGMCVTAATEQCGAQCSCDALAPADLACTENADCAFCDSDGDLCNGGWSCNGGTCSPSEPVVCDAGGDSGCVVSTCQPDSGECMVVASDAACADGNVCTADSCSEETNMCVNEAITECVEADYSCDGKCGDFGPDAPCQCDPDCFGFGDCCEDICTKCQADYPEDCPG